MHDMSDPERKKAIKEYIAAEMVAGFDDKGNVIGSTGEVWLKGKAMLSAGSMNKHDNFVVGDTRVNMNQSAFTDGVRASIDSSHGSTDGHYVNKNAGIHRKSDAQVFLDEMGLDPVDAGGSIVDTVGTLGSYAGLAGLTEMAHRSVNAMQGKRTATKEFTYDTGKTDKDGKPIMETKTKGSNFNTTGNEALEKYLKENPDVSQIERGKIGKATGFVVDKIQDTGAKLRGSFSSNKTLDKTKNGSSGKDYKGSDSDFNYDGKQNPPPSGTEGSPSKDTSSIPNDTEKVKPLSQQPIDAQIDAQTKYDRKMASIDADIASKKELFAQQNALNGGGASEQLERQKMDIAAMEGARSQIAKPDFSAPKAGFFSRMGDAYDQSSGGFFKKAMGAAAIMTMGAVASGAGTLVSTTHTGVKTGETALQTVSNTLGDAEMVGDLGTLAATGMSKYSKVAMTMAKMGARVTPGLGLAAGAADITYRVSQGDTAGAWMSGAIAAASTIPVAGTALAVGGTIAQAFTDAAGITGVNNSSTVPQHAQTAFSTPAMAHTSAAMSDPGYNPADSKNAYGDTTNVANTGAAGYKTDSTQESLDRQEDTSLGIEYMQEETSRAADASEKLLDTIYSNNQSRGDE